MAVCEYCNQDKLEVSSCVIIEIQVKGELYNPIKFGDEQDYCSNADERCSDCFVEKGGYHHPGCARERCPVCGGQLISCGCLDDDDDDDF